VSQLSNESDDEKVLSNGPGSYRVAHCDTNGSHVKPADVFIDGMTYNLLNNKNDNEHRHFHYSTNYESCRQ
jgi:hypothetical protein